VRPFESLLAAGVVLGLSACSSAPVGEYRASSGTLALSRDGAEVYAVDSDNDLVAILSSTDLRKIAEVKVGHRPERIAVGADGTLFVTNKGDRTVSFVKRGAWMVLDTVTVGIEPVGVDVTRDGNHVLVASSTSLSNPEVGTLTSIDARTRKVEWQLDVGPEAHAVRVVPGDKAYVSLFKSGTVAVVDLGSRRLLGGIDLTNPGAFAPGAASGSKRRPSRSTADVAGTANLVTDIAIAPDGKRAFATHVRARDAVVVQTTPGGGGYGGAEAPRVACGRGPIAAPALATVEVGSDTSLVDDFRKCQLGDSAELDALDYPTNILDPNPTGADPVQGPAVAVVEPSGEFVYIGNLLTNNVAVVATGTRKGRTLLGSTGITQIVRTGSGPTGLAVAADGKTLFVHHQLDHSVGAYRRDSTGRIVEVSAQRARYARDVLPPGVVAGRKLFFSADNPVMTRTAAPIACATCHPSGREDGRVWAFPEGPRQTPSLAGRMIEKTAPYHWAGELATIDSFFEETVKNRMGGRGFAGMDDLGAKNLMAFLMSLEAPDYPAKGLALDEKQLRGKAVFQKASCSSCHSGETFADNKNHDVGTLVRDASARQGDRGNDLNTPSLLGVSRTWPYLHDGSATTLMQCLMRDPGSNRHGTTQGLSSGELEDLVEYLKTL
jgi:YVTN family beta-propeller protein